MITASLITGFAIGRYSSDGSELHHQHADHELPDGLPRSCCETARRPALTKEQKLLPDKLKKIVGRENVLDGMVSNTSTLPFLKGARLGEGSALCIVTPRKLHDVVRVVKAAIDADCVIVPQGQNTGLTGGSVPRPSDERASVVISMKYLDSMFPIDNGKRIVCLAGVGLASLQQFIQHNFPERESHSVLGSTFLNPTTAAGVAFGSGGTQCRKGPAYTERALYLKVTTNKWNERIVEVVNTLGVKGMEDINLPAGRSREVMDSVAWRVDTWARWIREGRERDMRYSVKDCKAKASDVDYARRLCEHDDGISRYNADTSGPDCCRSEGKVILLATVHDTFRKPKKTQTFWLSFDSLDTALDFRREVALVNANDMPISMEYMDRDAFDVIDQSGRVLGTTIKVVGTSSPIVRSLWSVKLWIESLPFQNAATWVDRGLYAVNSLIPPILPDRIMEAGRTRDHHVAMTVGEFGDGNMDRLLQRMNKFASKKGEDRVTIHALESDHEVRALTAFRFVAAPAFRTFCVGEEGAQGYSVDYALPKNRGQAPPLRKDAPSTHQQPIKRMRYSHFACNVVHEDVAYARGVDVHEAKLAHKAAIETQAGGKLPAEHGHGTEYTAPVATQSRWMHMDPLNMFNPGIGGLSRRYRYEDDEQEGR